MYLKLIACNMETANAGVAHHLILLLPMLFTDLINT